MHMYRSDSEGQRLIKQIKAKTKCKCGETRNYLFEFAHWDRRHKRKKNGKSFDLADMKSEDDVKLELEKGRFLCLFCHRNETHRENIVAKDKFKNDLLCRCKKKKARNGKQCQGIICRGNHIRKCEFNHRRSKCDSCVSLERISRKCEKQKMIKEYKKNAGTCAFCGMECREDNSHLFEWDHIFGKNYNVCDLVEARKEVIENEIRLCRLLCLKCHRIKSLMESRNQWYGDILHFIDRT